MADIASLIKELDSATAFVAAQARLNIPGYDIGLVKSGMAKSLAAKIRQLGQCTASDAAVLSDAVGRSCFEVEGRAALADAIATILAGVADVPKLPQSLVYPERFLTSKDWEAVTAGTLPQKAQVVVDGMLRVGLTHPSESAVGRLAGLVAATHWPEGSPGAEARYDVTQRLKTCFKSSRGRVKGLPHVRNHPDYPSELPAALQRYSVDDPPITHEPASYQQECRLAVLRNSSKQLRGWPQPCPPQHWSCQALHLRQQI